MVLIRGKTLNHQVYEINVNINTKISIIKKKFSELLDNKLNMYDYKIIHLGNSLDDDDVITEEHESKLFIIMTIKKKPEDIKEDIKKDIKADIKADIKEELNQNFTFTMDNPPVNNNLNADSSNHHILNFLNTILINNNSLPENNSNNLFVNNFLNDPSNNAMLSNFLNGTPDNLFSALNILGSENKDNEDVNEDVNEDDNEDDNDEDDKNDEGVNGGANEEENKTNIPTNSVVNPVQNNDELYNVAMIGNFSQTDTDNINEIVSMGFNYYEVIQYYTASGKNIDMTLELLIKNS